MISQLQPKLIRHAFFYNCSEIAIRNAKKQKRQNRRSKKFTCYFIILKVVVNNKRDAFGAYQFT